MNCEFADTSKEVKSQIIQGCHSTRLRRKALLRDDTDLTGLLSAARALELSEKHATEIEQSDRDSANAVRKSNQRRRNNPRYLQKQSKFEPKKKTNCRNCGGEFPYASKSPVLGKTCNFCRKVNHFVKVCRSKRGRQNTINNARVNNLGNNESEIAYSDTPDSSSDDDYVFGLREAMLVNKVQKERSTENDSENQ